MIRFSYYLRRLGSSVFTIWVIITITFFLMKAIPGDPFMEEKAIPKEVLASLHHYYHLDEPLYKQYLCYLKGIITGNFGPSLKYKNRTASEIIKTTFPISALLGMQAFCLAIGIGFVLASISATKQGKWQDYGCICFAILAVSIPSFLLATLLQYCFAIKLQLLPVACWGTYAHAILPALSLSAMPAAFITRMLRTTLIEVFSAEYIITARAKGLSTYQIIRKHALKNALLPLVSYCSLLVTNIVTGSFVIETIFGIPGLGNWFIQSVFNRDYPIIMGLTVFYSSLLIFCVFLIDMSYSLLDPKIRITKKYDD